MGGMEAYESDFEAFLLTETAKHYARKASLWIEEDSCPTCLIKAERCRKEGARRALPARVVEAKLLKKSSARRWRRTRRVCWRRNTPGARRCCRTTKPRTWRVCSAFSGACHRLAAGGEIFKHVEHEGLALVNADEVAPARRRPRRPRRPAAPRTKMESLRRTLRF